MNVKMDHATSEYPELNVVRRLLRHNCPCSEQEEYYLRQRLFQLSEELATLETRLKQRRAKSKSDGKPSLLKQHSHLKQLEQAYKTVLSPLRYFPPEIMTIIFAMTVEPISLDTDVGTLERAGRPSTKVAGMLTQAQSRTGPYALSQVCSSWRQLALDMPCLWNSFSIVGDGRGLSSFMDAYTATALFDYRIGRSGSLPLDVSFRSELFQGLTATNVSQALLNRLIDHAERWRSVQLLIWSSEVVPHLHRLQRVQLLNLQEIELSLMAEGDRTLLNDIFSCAPQLKRFRYQSFLYRHNVLDFQLPWSQLIDCEFYLDDAQLPVLLQRSPNLRQLAVYSTKHQTSWETPAPLTHDTLERLGLFCSSLTHQVRRTTLPLMLPHLRFPRLKKLLIHGCSPKQSNGISTSDLSASLRLCLANSQFLNLQTLTLDCFCLDMEFWELVKAVSSTCHKISCLRLGVSRIDNGDGMMGDWKTYLASSLIDPFLIPNKLLLPNLEELSFSFNWLEPWYDIYALSASWLVAMVRSRRDSNRQVTGIRALRKFELVLPYKFEKGNDSVKKMIPFGECRLEELATREFEVVVSKDSPF
ncbi:hypothetical protein VKT23_008525 [Stygiomarasmius scandens]|uniref:F-box domain-containing protein n=1 Tax=Marasmiellus scandens TaxID=2682957 RepID=A0ABR1JHI9_9AGAR